MASDMERTELEAIRHDLKNVLTSLRHGCTLISAQLGGDEHEESRAFLGEMLSSIEQGFARLRDLDAAGESTGSGSSGREE